MGEILNLYNMVFFHLGFLECKGQISEKVKLIIAVICVEH